jgi:hypothetical protein
MFLNDLSSTIVWPWCVSWNKNKKPFTPVNWSLCFYLLSWQLLLIRCRQDLARSLVGDMECWTCGLGRFFCVGEPRRLPGSRRHGDGSNSWKVLLVPSALVRIKLYLIFWYTCIFVCYLSGNLEEAIDHLTIAILLNLKSAIYCFSCYDGCVDNDIDGTMLPQPRCLKWQVNPKAPFALCCGLFFQPSSTCVQAIEPLNF